MNNTCLLIALGVVIFVIMQNKGGSKGSLSVKSLSKSSKSIMNTNVPIICVGVIFLAYMFMNNGGIEGFPPADNSCGISKSAEDSMLSMTPSGGSSVVINDLIGAAALLRGQKNMLIGGISQADCTNGLAKIISGGDACNRIENGVVNANCGYFYKSPNSNVVWGDEMTTAEMGVGGEQVTWRVAQVGGASAPPTINLPTPPTINLPPVQFVAPP